jgi:hypothetical protein
MWQMNRTPKVFWVKKKEPEKSLLIFDSVYFGGDFQIFEYKETCLSKEIEDKMSSQHGNKKLSEIELEEMVRRWVEKKFGHTITWDLK